MVSTLLLTIDLLIATILLDLTHFNRNAMQELKTMFNGIAFTITCSDLSKDEWLCENDITPGGITFISSELGWNDETNHLLKTIRQYKKTLVRESRDLVALRLEAMDLPDIGMVRYTFNLKRNLHFKMKTNGLNITQYINLSILEKLERDNL